MQTPEANKQFNMMCKYMEQGYAGTKMDGIFKSLIDDSDIYLFSREKTEASYDYWEERKDSFEFPDIEKPVVMANGIGCSCISVSDTNGYIIRYKLIVTRYKEDDKEPGKSHFVVAAGSISVGMENFSIEKNVVLNYFHQFTIRNKVIKQTTKFEVDEELKRAFVRQSLVSMRELLYSKVPHSIVVLDEPSNRRPYSAKTIARRDDRPVYVVLTPEEVVTIKKSLGGTHASPIPHKRKAHDRVLRHERFKQRGKTIKVKESNINVKPGDILPSDKKRIYKVVSVGS